MSPLALNFFRETPTTLELNGPTLGFTTSPVGVATFPTTGTATFTGLATATFTDNASAANNGTLSYRWYDQNGALSDGGGVSGSGTTTLTLTNLSTPGDNARQIFLRADYIPSAYGSGNTGNATNDPLDTTPVTLTVYPSISITTQPQDVSVGNGLLGVFNAAASISDSGFGALNYYWTVDGTIVSDQAGSGAPGTVYSDGVSLSEGGYDLTGDGSKGAEGMFDGGTTYFTKTNTNAASINVVFTPAITASTSLRVYTSYASAGSGKIKITAESGGPVVKELPVNDYGSAGFWVDCDYTGTISSIEFTSPALPPYTNFDNASVNAIELDGSILTDSVGGTSTPYISGANTTTLTIQQTIIGSRIIKFHSYVDTPGGRVTGTSDEALFTGLEPRRLVRFEAFNPSNQISKLDVDLDNFSTYSIFSHTFGSTYGIISFHAPEKEVDLRLELSAAKGLDSGGNLGGYGGSGTIDLTMEQDIEYTLVGLANDNGLFLYRGSVLIACVGGGGNAGNSGKGGRGGGFNIAGEAGGGGSPGSGGSIPLEGYSLTGTYGSQLEGASITLYPGDTIASAPAGGQTISCTKGSYWIDQGISACSDNSTSKIKFTNTDGTLISDSAEIVRGFKPGYTVTTTGGKGVSGGALGGHGATGGGGGTSNAGGGGGSGFEDGSVTVVSTELGGNSLTASKALFSLQTTSNTVSFAVSRNSLVSNYIDMQIQSGSGPATIRFGPTSGTISTVIALGSVYKVVATSMGMGAGVLSLDTTSNKLILGNNFDLTVIPSAGTWNDTTTYTF